MTNPFADILFKTTDSDIKDRLSRLKNEHSMVFYLKANTDIADRVKEIVKEVGLSGDRALADFTARFDGISLTPDQFRITDNDLQNAHKQIDPELLKSLKKAIDNVKRYQSEIFIGNTKTSGIRYRPLKRVGLCIPGASAPLPSTVIMTAVPAIVAGVKDIVIISPPRFNDTIHPVILALCFELGIKEVYRIGGAQAVAALAWGTETIPKVDKIVGPGNDYVQLAKKEVFGLVDMDSFAGPSDVLIVADDHANPAWTAADMLSQAEHNPGAAILITPSEKLAECVMQELETQLKQLDRSDETAECLKNYSAVIVTQDMNETLALANDFAAEHLEVQCGKNSRSIADKIDNAGAIFIGDYTPVAVGDYWAGPSHTLPTRQSSKYFSAVTSNDFIKSNSIIEYSQKQLCKNAEDIVRLAMTEGLDAHAKSVSIRTDS